MNLKLHRASKHTITAGVGVAALLLFGSRLASAQPTIVSTLPPNLASGVSPSAPVVFTFSEPMDTTNTAALFLNPPSTRLTTMPSWSANNTVLSCTPNPVFPANTSIFWEVIGQNFAGMSLSGNPSGFFSTGTGSVSTAPVVLNPAWSGANFGFDVGAPSNQVLKVRYSPDCTRPIAQWQTILTTNNTGTSVHIIIPPQPGTNAFFLVQAGR